MDLATALEGIVKHRGVIESKQLWDKPTALSEEILKLAAYNCTLAEHRASLHRASTEKRLLAYKAARDMESTQGDSEMLSKLESLDERTEFEHINHVYNATDKFITVAQTQLRTIENQIKREGVQQT